MCRAGSVVVVVRSGILKHTLPVAILRTDAAINQDLKCFDCGNDGLNAWLALSLRAHARRILVSNREGTTVQSVKYNTLKQLELPLPPLAEQRRIVAKLEKLLERVNACRERLDRIPAILKRFRQSVLSAAYKGDLTANWREEHESVQWKDCCFGDLIETSANGLSKRRGDSGDLLTVLRLADFKNAVRVYGKERQIRLTNKEVEKYGLMKGDLLVIRVNGSVDLAGLFICYDEGNREEAYCDHFIRFRVNQGEVSPKFITYVANEGEGRWYLRSQLSTSAGQNTINQKSISALPISLPPLAEQQEIVRRVDELFALADQIEARYAKAKEQVHKLTQSILAKAFRGELVPQDPNDEPADQLLARIRAARAAQEAEKETKKRAQRKKAKK
jgi:type I restriction enzyme S subunit